MRFALNGLGQRVEKRSRRGETLFVYGLNGELIARANPMGRTQRDYIYVNGAPAAVIVYPSFGGLFQRGLGGFGGRGLRNARSRGRMRGALYYIHTDHLGTPRVITSSRTGTVVWRWDGEPFGASRPDEDPGRGRRRFVFNLRFPGQYYDAETGLDYNYYRDYDPRTGRYVESDPTGLLGGLDTYGYVSENPILYIDSQGLDFAIPIPGELIVPSQEASPLVPGGEITDPGVLPLPDTAQPPDNRNSDDCKALARKIENIRKDIQKREQEIRDNPGNLPERLPRNDPRVKRGELRHDVHGHRVIVRKLERRLRELENKYDIECRCEA